MATNLSFYIVPKDVALRTGDISNCYKTDDGRYVMDSRQLQRIRLTGDEYLTGLQGVELIDRNEALTLIAKGGYTTDSTEEETASATEGEGGQADEQAPAEDSEQEAEETSDKPEREEEE